MQSNNSTNSTKSNNTTTETTTETTTKITTNTTTPVLPVEMSKRHNNQIWWEDASRIGDIEILNDMLYHNVSGFNENCINLAISSGQLETLKWFMNNNMLMRCSLEMLKLAIKNNYIEILEYFLWKEKLLKKTIYPAMMYAMEINNIKAFKIFFFKIPDLCNPDVTKPNCLKLLIFLHENDIPYTNYSYVLNRAIICNKIPIVKWFHENRPDETYDKISIEKTAERGHISIIKWLHDNNRDEGFTAKVMDLAAKNGHIDVIIWLHENRTEGCTTDAMDSAMSNGNLKVVKWLYENRTEGCTRYGIQLAVRYGNLQVVKFLHEHYMNMFSMDIIEDAASYGHLRMVEYFFHLYAFDECDDNDKEIIEEVIETAAKKGYFNIVEFLLKYNFHCSTDAIHALVDHKRFDIINYIITNNQFTSICNCSIIEIYRVSIVYDLTNTSNDDSDDSNDNIVYTYLYDIFKNAIENFSIVPECIIETVVRVHDFNTLKWIYDINKVSKNTLLKYAIEYEYGKLYDFFMLEIKKYTETYIENGNCSICLTDIIQSNEIQTICNHTFHKECISEWFDRGMSTCPMCREIVCQRKGCYPWNFNR
jgi:hypothetical protein